MSSSVEVVEPPPGTQPTLGAWKQASGSSASTSATSTVPVEFWEGVIGIPVSSRTEIPNVKEVVLQADVFASSLPSTSTTPARSTWVAMWKLYVDTEDCQALYDKAIAAGCESVSPPQQLDRWPVTVAFIKDFDGYLIELLQNHEGKRPSLR